MSRYFFILLLLYSFTASAQSLSASSELELELYAFRVKNIEDFIKRFNNDSNSSVMTELKAKNKDLIVSRNKMLFSTFNFENNELISDSTTRMFFNYVVDTVTPHYIRFRDSGWYAEALGLFTYKSDTIELPIVLRVKTKGRAETWMIAGIGDHPLLNERGAMQEGGQPASGKLTAIPPTNESVNFLELKKVFNASLIEDYYFDGDLLQTDKAKQFVGLIKSAQLKLQYVSGIKFHFYQIPGWVFTVEEFNRLMKNSGWLISNVRRADDSEKKQLIQDLLHR